MRASWQIARLAGIVRGMLSWKRFNELFNRLFAFPRTVSGRSAAWLARLVRDQEVEGSNPFAPTIPILLDEQLSTRQSSC